MKTYALLIIVLLNNGNKVYNDTHVFKDYESCYTFKVLMEKAVFPEIIKGNEVETCDRNGICKIQTGLKEIKSICYEE